MQRNTVPLFPFLVLMALLLGGCAAEPGIRADAVPDYEGLAEEMASLSERRPGCGASRYAACARAVNAAVDLARTFENLYLELTAVFDDRGVLEKYVREAGSDRMLFGTDLPWFDPHQAVGALLSAEISDEDRHNICHRNAEKLLEPRL